MDAGLRRELEAKVYAGERLTRADGLALYASDDLAWLGRLAHHRRGERAGDRVLFSTSGENPDKTQTAFMVYGHEESPADRVDAVLALRDRPDGTFVVFAPVRHEQGTAAPAESLKTFAVSRLLFDNVLHVKCLWRQHGLSVAQLLLNFGADELDGSAAYPTTATFEDARGDDPTADELAEVIQDAGFRPAERDAAFRVIREFDAPVPLAERRSEPQRVWA